MDPVTIIIQLLSGALGGNVVGALVKRISLGLLGNSLAGILGGSIGGQILGPLLGLPAATGGGLNLEAILAQVAGGGAGGGLLMVVIGVIKSMLAKR